mmetsp:Transcript_34016/g.67079  ORF Transcript_34016/g.67079 Transcript_34016/m.67079 type:complete len:94 (-) Transcript_34016:2-283(-)
MANSFLPLLSLNNSFLLLSPLAHPADSFLLRGWLRADKNRRTSEHIQMSKETKNKRRGGQVDKEARDEETREWRLGDEVRKEPGTSSGVTSGA